MFVALNKTGGFLGEKKRKWRSPLKITKFTSTLRDLPLHFRQS